MYLREHTRTYIFRVTHRVDLSKKYRYRARKSLVDLLQKRGKTVEYPREFRFTHCRSQPAASNLQRGASFNVQRNIKSPDPTHTPFSLPPYLTCSVHHAAFKGKRKLSVDWVCPRRLNNPNFFSLRWIAQHRLVRSILQVDKHVRTLDISYVWNIPRSPGYQENLSTSNIPRYQEWHVATNKTHPKQS